MPFHMQKLYEMKILLILLKVFTTYMMNHHFPAPQNGKVADHPVKQEFDREQE